MATWTDGAAYAPIERPHGFATPEVAPLEVAVPEAAQTPGPMPTPSGFAPLPPMVPLAHVASAPPATRNPAEPFLVSGGLLTAASSMGPGLARDPRTPFAHDAVPGAPVELPPPSGPPLAPPAGAPLLPPMGAPGSSVVYGQPPFPAPSPLQRAQEQTSQRMLVFLAMACVVIGLAVAAVAPWMLIVAGSLAMRTARITGRAGSWALGLGLSLLVLSVLVPADAVEAMSRLVCLGFVGTFGLSAARTYGTRR